MSQEILHIHSISQLINLLELPKAKHPQVLLIRTAEMPLNPDISGLKISSELYMVALKEYDCGLQYGRNKYDFQEGSMVFVAPNQVISSTGEVDPKEDAGWMLFFHPDLIRKSPLGKNIDKYRFFDYEAHEALHLSEQEKLIVSDIALRIKDEYEQRIDQHSQSVIVSNLELMLNYCLRFYDRQFNTRADHHKDFVSQFESLLKDYFNAGKLKEKGIPALEYFAESMNFSPNYLSDLLKKETGRSTKDHVNGFIIEKAKTLLLNSNHTVSEIAYELGFNYPHYFSRLFKSRTGFTPQNYRVIN